MFTPAVMAPSILSADFMHLADEIRIIEEAGAGYVHVDVMDGHFVPNLTIGVPVVKRLKKITDLPLDVHLMITNPQIQIAWFLDAGADIITFHIEACPDISEALELCQVIHDGGAKACVAIKPKTPTGTIEPLIGAVDMILVMSVEPGFSGQSFIEGSDVKIAEVARMAEKAGVSPLIEVDGGIGLATAPLVSSVGADVLVCGNAVYAAKDPGSALRKIEACAREAQPACS